ncbi:unnamed protein product [Soboliphyme baturini]|uniref:Calcium uniporter protein n=1 Tax=Soboliphyme baturini TaxID=241478 RepID=A0A183J1H2_9BILA|nr:unnamed protein product [Soboliphyme baturini]
MAPDHVAASVSSKASYETAFGDNHLKRSSDPSDTTNVQKFFKDGVFLMAQFNTVLKELEPMENEIARLKAMSERRTSRLMWLGLAFMGIQGGIFARLTWWEYSWDVMEPVTYFATYSVAIVSYAYFLITKEARGFSLMHIASFTVLSAIDDFVCNEPKIIM